MKTLKIQNQVYILLLGSAILVSCQNHNDYDPDATTGKVKVDTTINGAVITPETDKNLSQENQGHESIHPTDASNNQITVGKEETKNTNAEAVTPPQNNPAAMQKANGAVSGVGTSGHVSANPAVNDPNNKAKIDSSKYK